MNPTMIEEAERLAVMINDALKGMPIDLEAHSYHWTRHFELAQDFTKAGLARPRAAKHWACARRDPTVAVAMTRYVKGLWAELIIAAIMHAHARGFGALWPVGTQQQQYSLITYAFRTGNTVLVQWLTPRLADELYQRVALSAVRDDDVATLKILLDESGIQVRGYDVAQANGPKRDLLTEYYYALFRLGPRRVYRNVSGGLGVHLSRVHAPRGHRANTAALVHRAERGQYDPRKHVQGHAGEGEAADRARGCPPA